MLIKVKRINYWSLGAMLWFVIMDANNKRYQRLSLNRSATDEVLLLTKVDDMLDIVVVEQAAVDVSEDDRSTTRIVHAEFNTIS